MVRITGELTEAPSRSISTGATTTVTVKVDNLAAIEPLEGGNCATRGLLPDVEPEGERVIVNLEIIDSGGRVVKSVQKTTCPRYAIIGGNDFATFTFEINQTGGYTINTFLEGAREQANIVQQPRDISVDVVTETPEFPGDDNGGRDGNRDGTNLGDRARLFQIAVENPVGAIAVGGGTAFFVSQLIGE